MRLLTSIVILLSQTPCFGQLFGSNDHFRAYISAPIQYIEHMQNSSRWSADMNFGIDYYLVESRSKSLNLVITFGSDLRFNPLTQTIGGSLEAVLGPSYTWEGKHLRRLNYSFGWIRLRSAAHSRSNTTYAGGIGRHRFTFLQEAGEETEPFGIFFGYGSFPESGVIVDFGYFGYF